MQNEHVAHGGSVCKRFWNCPGCIQASEGRPNVSSPYADEGTRAHTLIELCLRNRQDAEEYVGRMIDGVEVDAETAEYVQIFIDHCNSTRGDSLADTVFIEERVDLAPLRARVPLTGTVDYGQIVSGHRLLIVNDYKHGAGVKVEGVGNPQTRYYALGLLFAARERFPHIRIDRVRMSIVQPRIRGSLAIQTEEIDAFELVEWGAQLIGRVEATLQPDAPLVAGEWCKFCPAAPCRAQYERATELARATFAEPYDGPRGSVGSVNGWVLSPEELSELLGLRPLLDEIMNAAEGAALAELRAGRPVPNWKLVDKRPQREWKDPAAAEATLAAVYEIETRHPPALVSPAQAEERIAPGMPGKTAKARKEAARLALARLIESESSGTTIAPESDKRPALRAGGQVMPDETSNPGILESC